MKFQLLLNRWQFFKAGYYGEQWLSTRWYLITAEAWTCHLSVFLLLFDEIKFHCSNQAIWTATQSDVKAGINRPVSLETMCILHDSATHNLRSEFTRYERLLLKVQVFISFLRGYTLNQGKKPAIMKWAENCFRQSPWRQLRCCTHLNKKRQK